jgi:2',3'-cyclic-nucleotide 2'-phosphodiesterase / 3'-nucleotidase
MRPVQPAATTTTRRRVLTGMGLSAAGLALRPALAADAAPGRARLRLLATSDVHVYLHPYDYYRDREDDTVGLARVATLVRRAREEVPNSLLLDNGDFLQGSPIGDYVAYEKGLAAGDLHPMVAAMNELGIEAATLGNHEFNYGLEFLERALAGGRFPFVLANVARGTALGASPRQDRTLVRPYVILERELVDEAGGRHPIRVGVIGLTPPQIVVWDKAHLEGNVAVRDIAEAAAAWVPEMREAGADLVVALSHSGIAVGGPQGAENASLHVAGVEGVDVVVTGHQHQLFPGPTFAGIDGVDQAAGRLRGKPAVMPGFWGSHLGVVDLALARDGGAWRVMDSAVETRPIYERVDNKPRALVGSEEAILAVARPAHEATLAYVRRPVGRTSVPIQSYFALVADDPSVQVVNDAQLWYARKLHAEGPHRDLPLLAAAAPFKAGGRGGPDYYTDVPAGDLAIRNIADIYLYPNTLRAVLVDGRTLKEWLERSAGIFRRIDPQGSGEQALIDPAFPSFNFDVIDGVTYEIDVTRPARYAPDGALAEGGAERIVNLRHEGRPVEPAQRFVVVTNNYRAGGGGKFPGLDGGNVVLEAPDLNRDVVVRYVKETGTIAPAADGNWRLAPTLGSAKVVFETGSGAERYAAGRRDVARVGPVEGGFVRYEVRPA